MTHPKTGSRNILDRIKTQTLVLLILHIFIFMGFPGGSNGKESACNKCPGKGNGNSLQYSCLENSMDRSAWQATVHGGHIESGMTVRLTYKHTHTHTHTHTLLSLGFLSGSVVKNLPANAGDARDSGLIPGSGRSPWSKKWQPTPIFLPGKPYGQRNLAGCSPWGHNESDTTE